MNRFTFSVSKTKYITKLQKDVFLLSDDNPYLARTTSSLFIWMKLHRVTYNRAIYKQLVYINARIVRETYKVIISCVLAKKQNTMRRQIYYTNLRATRVVRKVRGRSNLENYTV